MIFAFIFFSCITFYSFVPIFCFGLITHFLPFIFSLTANSGHQEVARFCYPVPRCLTRSAQYHKVMFYECFSYPERPKTNRWFSIIVKELSLSQRQAA